MSAAAQFTIELAIYGLVPCSSKNWTAAASLRRLREQQEGWRCCQWKKKNTINLQGNCKTYELRNGVWAFGHCEAITENANPRQLPPDYTTTITCFILPSGSHEANPTELEQWSLNNLEMSIRDFTIDPLVDLIALVEQVMEPRDQYPFRLHLRQLSDGRPHPMAAQSTLTIGMKTIDPTECVFGIQLQETSVGVLIKQQAGVADDYDYLAVWNWQTGDLELTKVSDVAPYDDFAFIDSCSVMLAVMENPVALQVYCFKKPKVYFAGAFLLPSTKDDFTYLELHFDGGPSASIAGPRSVDGTPYSLPPVPDILAITFGVAEARVNITESDVSGFTMVMSPRLMLDKLERNTANIPKVKMRDQLRVLPWKDWGAECTRWIPERLDSLNWQPSMQAGRYAVVVKVSENDAEGQDNDDAPSLLLRKQAIHIYDFRTGTIHQNIRKGLKNGIQVLPTLATERAIFEENVFSCLPYHCVQSEPLPTLVSGVMIDEGRLVCTKIEETDEWRQLLVLTF
ncbi:hypothetical protein Clacol_009270 [Clathrus columnatus]|uniref:Uncharacterized protein n=1 Tax=Clathrus columnatus TaxID=1419009 RepID=A0AAV5AK47_9AGAM|nr:hypothetical protein Clacol_009270 [Clathrus columnatus]